jgi:hypothetical protein
MEGDEGRVKGGVGGELCERHSGHCGHKERGWGLRDPELTWLRFRMHESEWDLHCNLTGTKNIFTKMRIGMTETLIFIFYY